MCRDPQVPTTLQTPLDYSILFHFDHVQTWTIQAIHWNTVVHLYSNHCCFNMPALIVSVFSKFLLWSKGQPCLAVSWRISLYGYPHCKCFLTTKPLYVLWRFVYIDRDHKGWASLFYSNCASHNLWQPIGRSHLSLHEFILYIDSSWYVGGDTNDF